MSQVTYFFEHLLDASLWPPRWVCGQWSEFTGWLYILSDIGTWLAYTSIPLWLAIFVTRRRDLPFPGIFWLFIAFILLCGTTHLLDALAFWWPVYHLNVLVRFATAVVSLVTVCALVPVLPKAFALRTPQDLETEVQERKRAEEELRRTAQDLQHQTHQLQAVNRELEAFSYSVSHDLRTPLRSMDGYSQALLEDYSSQLDDTGRHYLQRIRANSQHMGQLIDDLLTLSNMSRTTLQYGPVALSALARDVAEELCELEPERQVEFHIRPDMQVAGDSRLFRLVLQNLLENAWKFSRGSTPAIIEVNQLPTGTAQADRITYYVRDNGIGLDMTYADKLFNAFERLHGPEFPGSGIGLAIVKRVLERHGGKIWVESTPDQGATFYFECRPANETNTPPSENNAAR